MYQGDFALQYFIMQLYFYTGEYHKYDSIAYPRSTKISKSFLNIKEHAKGFISFVSVGLIYEKEDFPEGFTPLNAQQMSELCLECYLLRIKEMLCSGSFPNGQDINKIALEISFICKSVCTEHIILTSHHTAWVWSANGAAFKKVSHRLSIYCIYAILVSVAFHAL